MREFYFTLVWVITLLQILIDVYNWAFCQSDEEKKCKAYFELLA